MKFDWFRMHTEARADEKLESLPDAQHRVWFKLLCFAAEQQEQRGSVPCENRRLLAVRVARGDEALLEATVEALIDLDILVPRDERLWFVHFDERQYDKPSDRPDQAAARKRTQRDRARQAPDGAPSYVGVTPESRAVTPRHATEGEEEVEGDTDTDRSTDPVDPEVKETLAEDVVGAPTTPPSKKTLKFVKGLRALPGWPKDLELPVVRDKAEAWQRRYPGVELGEEIDRMHSWLLSNPKRKGNPSFVENWLRRGEQPPPWEEHREQKSLAGTRNGAGAAHHRGEVRAAVELADGWDRYDTPLPDLPRSGLGEPP